MFVLLSKLLHAIHRNGFAQLSQLLGLRGRAGDVSRLFRIDQIGRQTEKGFDRLGPQFHCAEPELNAVLENVLTTHGAIGETVGHIKSHLDAGKL